MPSFPRKESEIVALTTSMTSGYAAHAADFPNADPAAIAAAFNNYLNAKNSQTDLAAQAQVATAGKDEALADLEAVLKQQLKQSEVDVTAEPEKLELIGWAPKASPRLTSPPAQPQNFVATRQDIDSVTFGWDRPDSAAPRVYLIERRSQPADGGDFGPWQQIATTVERDTVVSDQPRGLQLEYRVKALNLAGASLPSNTSPVVL